MLALLMVSCMTHQWNKLFLDLTDNWWRQTNKKAGMWVGLVLLAVPIALITQLWAIKENYTQPHFGAMKSTENISQIVQRQGNTNLAVAPYISDEISHRLGTGVLYEKMNWVSIEAPKQLDALASFFSGGFSQLGIRPTLGSLRKLEFPESASQIHIAITHSFWTKYFSKKNVIGETLIISGEVAIISAVMPEQFKSFRRDSQLDIVIPHAYIERLGVGKMDEISPDVFSYVLANEKQKDVLINTMAKQLRESALLFDDESLLLSPAFGLSLAQYAKVIKRLDWLTQLFVGLLLFSLLAFMSYLIADNERRQNEIALRAMLGANRTQIVFQQLIEIIGLTLLLVALILIFLPLMAELISTLIPELDEQARQGASKNIATFFVIALGIVITIGSVFYAQQRWLSHSLGRGSSVSKGQKIQTFSLLTLLICVSSLSIVKTGELLHHQWQYQQLERGYVSENRYIATFEFPKIGGTFYANDLPKLLVTALEEHNSVENAALTSTPVMMDRTSYAKFYTPSMSPVSGLNNPQVLTTYISPNYFEVSGTELVFGDSITWDSYWQVVVSEALWDKHFKGLPLSQAKLIQVSESGEKAAISIVGVAKDIHLKDPDNLPEPMVYRLAATITGQESFIIKSMDKRLEIETAVSHALENIDTLLRDATVHDLQELIELQESPQKALLTTSFVLSAILVVTTLIFCFNSAQLMLKKSARELSLRLNVGAPLTRLIATELLHFIAIALPFMSICIALVARYWKDASHIMPLMLLLTFLAFLLFLSVVIGVGIRTIKRQAWQYLS